MITILSNPYNLSVREKIVLIMQGNQIKEKGATAIGDMLKKNSTITDVQLLLNDIGKYGGEAIFECLAHNSVIETLLVDIRCVPSNYDGMSLNQIRGFTTALEHG